MIVPDQDATYLHAHHKTQSVPEMAKELKRASATVYQYMATLGLAPKGREIRRDHPFKVQNRRLEAVIIENRQLKTGRKR